MQTQGHPRLEKSGGGGGKLQLPDDIDGYAWSAIHLHGIMATLTATCCKQRRQKVCIDYQKGRRCSQVYTLQSFKSDNLLKVEDIQIKNSEHASKKESHYLQTIYFGQDLDFIQ